MKKNPRKSGTQQMAGDQESFIRARLGAPLKNRFREATEKRGADMSRVIRQLAEAYCDAAEKGAPLIAPFEITSRGPGTPGETSST